MDLSRSINGYLAPEQVTPDERKYSRNALVDSFGIGMTFFFLGSQAHPIFSQQLHRDWEVILEERIGKRKCTEWRSLPRRYARLIKWATKNSQPERWDMTRIHGELVRLSNALRGTSHVDSAELIAEEIAARADSLAGSYKWTDDALTAEIEIKSGYTIRIVGNESDKKVQLAMSWMHTGDHQFDSVRKYIKPAAEKAASALRRGGWHVWDQNIIAGACRVNAELDLRNTSFGSSALDRLASGLSEAAAALRL